MTGLIIAIAGPVMMAPNTAAASATITARPFLGGGVVVAPHALKSAHVSIRVPRLRLACRKPNPGVVRIGVFGVRHFTSGSGGKVKVRRWFAGVKVTCRGRHVRYEAALGSTSAGPTKPNALVAVTMDGTPCANIDVENRANGTGVVSGCAGGTSGGLYDRTGNRVLVGAHVLHRVPQRTQFALKADINHRRIGAVPRHPRVQRRSGTGPIVRAATLHHHSDHVEIRIG